MKRYLFILIAATFLVYINSLGGCFVWDDLNNISANEKLKEPAGRALEAFIRAPEAPARFYRPIPYFTIFLDYLLWKDNPAGYHLTNLLFHLLNVIVVFCIVKRLFGRGFSRQAFVCAVMFALHPIHTSAAGYISGRSELIYSFFIFSSFYFYVISCAKPRKRWLGLSLFLFLLGLFSKEAALAYPLIILGYNISYLKKGEKLKNAVPFIFVGAGFCLFKYLFSIWRFQAIDIRKIYLIPKIILTYLRLLFLPFGLHMRRSLKEDIFFISMPEIIYPLIFICIIIAVIPKARKNKAFLLGLAWFIAGLVPFLGIARLNADIAEHWLYLASFGFFLMIIQWPKILNKYLVAVLALFFGLLTVQRNHIWRSDVSIYQDTIKYNPNDHTLHYNLGNAYLRKGLFDKASREYSISLRLKPDYADAWNNLGIIKERQNDLQNAFLYYRKAARKDPHLKAARRNLRRIGFLSAAYAQEDDSAFDNSLYAEVLTRFVKGAKVDYPALKNDPLMLNSYIKQLGDLRPYRLEAMKKEDKLALYINAYNAFTLKVIAQNYPVKSIRDIPGVWSRIKFSIAGKELTLEDIEHRILRKEFFEPRIHFALVCASKGCPKLESKPFYAAGLDRQLDGAALKFINDKDKVRLDAPGKTLYISSIFKWFGDDFSDPVEFIRSYLSADDSRIIQEGVKIRYLNYDWSLNE